MTVGTFWDDISAVLTYRLARLQSRLNTQASDIVDRNCGISLSQWRILALLSNTATKTLTHVAIHAGLDKGQISRNIKQLVADDYVTLHPSPDDNRQQLIHILPKGMELLERLQPIMEQRQAFLVENFSKSEREMLFRLIGKLDEKADKVDF